MALLLLVVAFLLVPGLLPATVEEQRARLPPPATCTDPVEGVWRSHQYTQYEDWYVFTLYVHRVPGSPNQLTGDIQAQSWDGSAAESEPPPCRPGLEHWTVHMTAQGTIVDDRIGFWGTAWRPENAFCGRAPGPGTYNLDHFTGRIDPALQEFQSVNNDGGRSVNEPTVFRRIRCFEPGSVPHVKIAPPPFYPAHRTGGCGC